MNMVMIYDPKTNRVVTIEKPLKEGWEGMTFPGGKVEGLESFYDAAVREIKEETGLTVENLKLCGTVEWVVEEDEELSLGFLYYTEDFSGEIVDACDEGPVQWMDMDEFRKCPVMSDSMMEILNVYDNDHFIEVRITYRGGRKIKVNYF